MAKKPTFSFEFDKTFGLALQSVEHRVQEMAQQFQPFNYIRGTGNEVDMKAETTEAPFIILFAPEGGQLKNVQQFTADSVRLSIGFFDLVNRAAYAEDYMAVQQAMRAAGEIFIKALNDSGLFEPITNVSYRFFSKAFSCYASGVVFSLTLQGSPLCIPSVYD